MLTGRNLRKAPPPCTRGLLAIITGPQGPLKCPRMKNDEILKESPASRFSSQWRPNTARLRGQVFTKPTCTIPDQSMSISEIIARFTRTGLVPQSYARRDDGGNTAVEPDFDPLDEYSAVMDAQASRKAAAQAAAQEHAKAPEGAAEQPPAAE